MDANSYEYTKEKEPFCVGTAFIHHNNWRLWGLEQPHTEAMRETDLFRIAQVILQPSLRFFSLTWPITNIFHLQAMLMMKGLISRCLNHEMSLDLLRARRQIWRRTSLMNWNPERWSRRKNLLCQRKLKASLKNRQSCWRRSWQTRKRKLPRPRTGSVRQKTKRYVSIVTLMPFWQSWEVHLLKALVTASVKSKHLIWT